MELKKPTIRDLLERSFLNFRSLPSIAFAGETPISYEELESRIALLSYRLIDNGICPGDRVAILGSNSPHWVQAYLALTMTGMVAVPILPGFPEESVHHIVRETGAAAVFIDDKYRHMVEEAALDPLHTIITLEDLSFKKIRKVPVNKTFAGWLKQHSSAPDTMQPLPRPEPDHLAVIIYTSGTTGHSKGVMLSHGNIAWDVIYGIRKFPIDQRDRFLSILPLSHAFEATGGMLCALATGVSIYYMKGMPTPAKLLESMKTVGPTGVLTVPLVMDKIYRKQILPGIQKSALTAKLYRYRFFRKQLHRIAGKKLVSSLGGHLRFFMFGGAALNEDVEIFLRDAGIQYSTGYGMTETSPIMTINPFGHVRIGSCGQPIPGIEMKIDNPDPVTGEGEIMVHGPIVMQGYYNNPDETAAILTKDGWLRTGDLGCFDSEDYLYIKGRIKNVIIGPSGENIYPEIIEQLYLKSSLIQEILVTMQQGKLVAMVYPDIDFMEREYGLTDMTASEAARRKLALLEEARHELNEALPAFMRINRIIESPEPFEKTPTNKIKRYLYEK